MDGIIELPMTIGQLRFRYAINHFKHLVLDDLHVPGKPQTDSVLDVLEKLTDKPPFSGRTWQDWFSKTPPIPKIGKVKALDELAGRLLLARGDVDSPGKIPEGTFAEIVHGGLMRSLLAPTKSKKVLHTLIGRANDYEPMSAIHLHLDAIEAAAWVENFEGLPWAAVTAIATQRILELLAERWAPRYGSLYDTFFSDFQLQWDAADPEERKNIRESCARWKPDPFDRLMQKGAQPDWRKTGCGPDIAPTHIYKLLFALAADPHFLVKDRLSAWFLDLTTSALAMHALAWTDRYTTMGHRVTDEMLYWAAFDEILFGSEPLEDDGWAVSSAMEYSQAEWTYESFGIFCKARMMYHDSIIDGGLSVKDVISVAMSARREHPLVYRA